MKLRISGDSLRLRLSPDEIAALGSTGRVSDSIRFGPAAAAITYEIVGSERAGSLEVRRDVDTISVHVPSAMLAEWTGTEQVGLEATLPNGAAGLRVLLEKDWQCLTERAGEDEAHLYPNPGATT